MLCLVKADQIQKLVPQSSSHRPVHFQASLQIDECSIFILFYKKKLVLTIKLETLKLQIANGLLDMAKNNINTCVFSFHPGKVMYSTEHPKSSSWDAGIEYTYRWGSSVETAFVS